jgi:hypothetical protein
LSLEWGPDCQLDPAIEVDNADPLRLAIDPRFVFLRGLGLEGYEPIV